MFKIQIPGWLIAAIFIITGLLIISLIRGCNNQKAASIAQTQSQEIKQLLKDSSENAFEAKQYSIQSEFQAAQLEASNDSIKSLNEDLDSLEKRVATLLKKHTPIEPAPDTTITTVPNEYIVDCENCFTLLSDKDQLVKKTRAEMDMQSQLLKGQIATRDNRISYLDKYTNQLSSSLKQLSNDKSKLEQRRTLYFKLGMQAINQAFPNYIGSGLMYQDKMKRIFNAGYYIGKYGPSIQFEIAFPLSLKKI